MEKKIKRYVFPFLIFCILIVAAFLRLYRISDYMTFLGDEGRDVLIVYNILHGNLTLLGPTASVGGFFLGPIYYYFMAPFLWIFRYDPVGPAVMVALFGVATVWLVYKISSELFDKKTGLIASFLYSLSPLVIAYSRSSWNPNLMPFFSLLSLYVIYKGVTKNKLYLFFIGGILLGIAMQLHYLTTFLCAVIITYIVVIKRNNFLEIIKYGIGIFIGFVIGLSPFLAFEARHGLQNIHSIINFILNPGIVPAERNIGFLLIVENIFFRLFGRLVTTFPPPEQVSVADHTNIAVWYYLTLLLAIGATGLLVFKLYKSFKSKDNDFAKLSLLFIWGLVGICLFGFYRKNIYDYYFGFLFPLPFILSANFFLFLWEKGKLLRVTSIIFFVLLILLNLSGIPFRSAPNRQKDQVRQISDFVLSKTNGKPYNFALLTLGNSDQGYRYFFKLEGKDPIVIQNPPVDPLRKSVADQLLIVCEDPNCHPLGASIWEIAGFGRAEIVEEWNVSVVRVYKLTHYKGK